MARIQPGHFFCTAGDIVHDGSHFGEPIGSHDASGMSGIAIVAAALDGDCDALRRHPYDPADPFWRTAEEHRVDLLLLDQARAGGLSEPWSAEVRELARRAAVDACAIR